jgi:hypothetical protein
MRVQALPFAGVEIDTFSPGAFAAGDGDGAVCFVSVFHNSCASLLCLQVLTVLKLMQLPLVP